MYTLADDLGSCEGALAVCRAGEIDSDNLTRVLVGLHKLSWTLLVTLEAVLASCLRAVILQSGVHCLVHRTSSPACFVIPLPLRKKWSSVEAQWSSEDS